MGYYSQVAFAVRGEKKAVMAKLMTFRLSGGADEKEALDSCSYHENGGDLIVAFEADNTKWYRDFDDVKALTALFDLFADDVDTEDEDGKVVNFDCAFLRIGEEDEDVEIRYRGYDPYDLVRFERSIDRAYPVSSGISLEALCLKSPISSTTSPTPPNE